ncbi:hypothetical protein, partial [Alistipes putredinis]|uniref:hypothetical protein n=1 Tax=Alistipes putredinis TaxID=28117 RepID=UPI003A837D2F
SLILIFSFWKKVCFESKLMRLRRFRVSFAGRGVRSSEKMVTFAENNPAWNSTKPTKNSCAWH